jgi:adenylate kinase
MAKVRDIVNAAIISDMLEMDDALSDFSSQMFDQAENADDVELEDDFRAIERKLDELQVDIAKLIRKLN